jgi:nitrilase
MGTRKLTVAAVQCAPVFLDREATVERIVGIIHEAAAAGADLVVLPEAIVPGYPDWVWRLPAWADRTWYERLVDQAVDIPGPAIDGLGQAARATNTFVSVGVTERVRSGTLYNTLVHLDSGGQVAGIHRKLIATGGERTVWGSGDASTLVTVDVGRARVGGLICWENLMPLARAATYAQGVDIYLAPTWDHGDSWIPTLQHIAREGRVFVVGTNTCLRAADIPRSLPGVDDVFGGDENGFINPGNTVVVNPAGRLLAGPLVGETGMLVVTLDLDELTVARRQFDPIGHYARPDVFELIVHQPHRSTPSQHQGDHPCLPAPVPPTTASTSAPSSTPARRSAPNPKPPSSRGARPAVG